MKFRILFLLFSVAVMYSCQSPPKNIVYFQDIDERAQQISELPPVNNIPRIKANDQLKIIVSDALGDLTATAQFNLPLATTSYSTSLEGQSAPAIQVYVVDPEGNISFPTLGKIKVEGFTYNELEDFLEEKISHIIKNPIVNVTLLNFRVFVIGDVGSPGLVTSSVGRMNILEAIANAGDLTITGKRENVLLIREIDGKKHFERLDLTSSDIFMSPYYNLQQNDILFIEPNESKLKTSTQRSGDEQFRMSVFSTILGAITTIATFIIAVN